MAHAIYEENMMYVGETPWHGIGRRLPKNATIDEMVEAAGFFTVASAPLHVPGSIRPVPGLRALVREDNGAVLAAVSPRYEIIQAREIAQTLVEAASGVGAIFHTAGLLGTNGARFWMLAQLPTPIRVKGDKSEVHPFLLASSAHDGSSPLILMDTPVRVVCQNTLNGALGGVAESRWAIRHTKSAQVRLSEAAEGFRKMASGLKRFEQLANVLASTKFTDRQLVATLDRVLPLPDDGKDHPRLKATRDNVARLFSYEGRGLDGIRGTGWGAWQAFTEQVDHHRTVRRSGGADEKSARLESIWFGGGAALKRAAFEAISAEAGLRLAA
jgi:phage/plasmid-like protein (TIGR03299 family)